MAHDITLFVTIWQKSTTQAQVMEAMNMKKSAVEHLAQRLRKSGVQLKRMEKNSEVLTPDKIAALNALIKGE